MPLRVHTVVVSVQHDEGISLEEMRHCLKEQVVKAVIPSGYLDDDTIYHLQPSGRFVIGGPQVRQMTLKSVPLQFFCAPHTYTRIIKKQINLRNYD